jgi:hypothetical protein
VKLIQNQKLTLESHLIQIGSVEKITSHGQLFQNGRRKMRTPNSQSVLVIVAILKGLKRIQWVNGLVVEKMRLKVVPLVLK